MTYADLESAKTVVLVGLRARGRGRRDLPAPAQGLGWIGGTRVLAIAPFTPVGCARCRARWFPTAPGDEPAALEALVGHADYGVDKTTVILVGERLATVPGALAAAAVAGAEDRCPARVGPAPGR